ncbi:uncharacterized protein [Asterias amurensis]|uniref:uncharacterized protein n=1 Tax=Asterias amurensis TaxID=7602 RepID=UPI003AB7C776
MTDFHLRGTGLEDHSLLNEDQVVTKKRHQLTGGTDRPSRRRRRICTSCRCWIVVALLSAMWLAFFGLWLYYSYFAIPSSGKPGAGEVGHNTEAMLVVLPESLADETGAYCLDGSPPSYYFRNASSQEHDTSWLVFLEGGGWCYNATHCAQKSDTSYGSSRMLNASKEFNGVLSANFTVNPEFYDWNVAVINYCDGASFSGNRDLPFEVGNKTIYFRGIRVLDAVITHLLSAGMAQADQILLSGASAGGLSVFLHADHVKELIPEEVSFKAMADAGFFLDEKNISNEDMWRNMMKGVYELQEVQGSLDEDCLLAKGTEKWECFFPEYAYPYINTPIFIINSALDYWTQLHILNLNCRPGLCDEKAQAFFEDHREYFLQRTDQVNRYDKDGMFISTCYAHSHAYYDVPWMNYKVIGKETRQAFADWYFGRSTPARSRYVDCDSSLNCNPSCAETWGAEYFNSTVCLVLTTDECFNLLH